MLSSMRLRYIGKRETSRDGGTVTWRQVLTFVASSTGGEMTKQKLAQHFKLGPDGDHKEKRGNSEALTRLGRLASWGMVNRIAEEELKKRGLDPKNPVFKITKYGREVLKKKTLGQDAVDHAAELAGLREEVEQLQGLGAISALEALPRGPVALMRVIDVSLADFKSDGIAALPGHGTLAAKDLIVERKFDGHLTQFVGGELYSRRGIPIGSKFPLITKALRGLGNNFLIGELTYWQDGQMDESRVTSVAGTDNPQQAIAKARALPGYFELVLFDVLEADGQDLASRPWRERRAALESLRLGDGLALSDTYDFADWQDAYNASLAEGGEGVVIKNQKSDYKWRLRGQPEARPAGVAWKVKKSASENFVAMKPRVSDKDTLMVTLFQLHAGRYVPIQELNNFSAAVEKEMVRRIHDDGMALIEVEYQDRSKDFPHKLRFGAFMRFRDDAPVESATMS